VSLLLNHIALFFVLDGKVSFFVIFLIIVDGLKKNQSSFVTVFAASILF
jgi:hypothetical protein